MSREFLHRFLKTIPDTGSAFRDIGEYRENRTKADVAEALCSGLRGFVSSFTAAITPDVGLTPTGLVCVWVCVCVCVTCVSVPDMSGEEAAVT